MKGTPIKSLGDIFIPVWLIFFVIVIPSPLSLTPCLDLGQRYSALEKVGSLDGRQIVGTDTGNIHTQDWLHPTLNSFPSSKLAPKPQVSGYCVGRVRIRADIKLLSSWQFIKIPVHFVHNGGWKHFDPEMFLILSAIFQNYLTPYTQFFPCL